MVIDEPWYEKLEDRYGTEFCYKAGYFDETQPFNHRYSDYFDLPEDSTVILYPGAFFPFHGGHLECLRNAIRGIIPVKPLVVVLLCDHTEYLRKKDAEYPIQDARDTIENLLGPLGIKYVTIFEDLIENNCSRNFTRLYQELLDNDNDVTFLFGGDHGNYALTTIDEGKTIISGRDPHPNYQKYKYLDKARNCAITFVPGNNTLSSTKIRNGNVS